MIRYWKCLIILHSVQLERKLYVTGKFHYFCALKIPTDQQVLKAVNDCSAYDVLLCEVVCFHGQAKRLEECAPRLFRLEEESCKLLQNVCSYLSARRCVSGYHNFGPFMINSSER